MVSVSQVSIEKEDSDVPRERVQNEVEDPDVARTRRVGIDEVSDSHSSGSVIQASPKVSIEKKDSDVPRKRLQNEVEDSDVARQRCVQEVSTTKEIGIDEVSDSYSSGSVIQASSKRPKVDDNIGSTSFDGVALQPNGLWGAQIHVNLQKIWLGTFSSKEKAAMAYYSAAMKARSSSLDSHRNMPLTDITIHEADFRSRFSPEVVLNMIQEGSYKSRFYDYLNEHGLVEQKPCSHKGDEFFCKKLFQKELSPSDVGKLSRLAIPKEFAVTHLRGTSEGGSKDLEIVCYDRLKKEWKFQFTNWKTNHSFFFTRGWKAFVEAKKLKAKDTVVFFSCQCSSEKDNTALVPAFGIDVERCKELRENDEQNNTLEKEDDSLHTTEKEKDLSKKDSNGSGSQEGFKLFGVQINI